MIKTTDGQSDESTAKLKIINTADIQELPCQITRRLLAILGALPIVLTPPYLPSLSITKSSVLYCIIVYSALSYDVIKSAIDEWRSFRENPTDRLRNLHLEHIFSMTPHFLGVYIWIDVPALLRTLERYKDVQVKFRSATGRPLINRKKLRELYSIVLVTAIYFILFGLTFVFNPKRYQFGFVTGIAFMYGNILAVCGTYLWLGLSWGISDAAADTKEEFRKQLDFITPSRVYEFRRLWLSMRGTLDSMGHWSSTPIVYSSSLVAAVIFLYEAAVLMQMGEIETACGHLISASFYAGLVSLICTASHGVEQQMKCLVGEVLPRISLTSYHIKVQREIVMLFLIESARPGATHLSGFIKVNKNLILSFFSNISTYIIVLVQFSQNDGGFGLSL